MESLQWENLYHLFCRKIVFLAAPQCQFRGVGQGYENEASKGKDVIQSS